MIPHPWVAVVLALAAYRVTRLIGWDDLPPILRARAWLTGETLHTTGSMNAHAGLTGEPLERRWIYKRPLLMHFLQCAFCQGFWTGCVWYVWWLLAPTSCLYAAAPFALGAAVGLISKNLDP